MPDVPNTNVGCCFFIFSYQHQFPWEGERVTDAEKPRGFGEKGESRLYRRQIRRERKNAERNEKIRKIQQEIGQKYYLKQDNRNRTSDL